MRNAIVLTLSLCMPLVAAAAELHVLCAGAARSAVEALIPAYEVRSGDQIIITYDTMGGLRKRIASGERADIIIGTREALADLAEKGLLHTEVPPTPLGAVGIGVAVRAGAPKPDISSVAALKHALLAAKSLVYVDPAKGTSGRHVATMMEQLGIAEQVNSKTLLIDGGYVVEAVAKGEAEIGLQQISEILPVKGVALVGPLPAEVQQITVYEIARNANSSSAAGAFFSELTGRMAADVFISKGFHFAR